MKYKILISDYDGTLIKSDRTMSTATIQAINSFVDRGGVFCVCTGRMMTGVDHYLRDYGLKGLLACFNGAEIVDLESGRKLYRNPIDNKTAIEVMKMGESLGLKIQCYPNDVYCAMEENARTKKYKAFSGTGVEIHPIMSKFLAETGYDTSKILVFDEPEKVDKAYPILKEAFPNLNVIHSNDEQIDINVVGASKGNACKIIAEKYGLTVNDVIGVGDANNDLPMLETVGFPIAMGNAMDSVKKVCKVIVPDNDHDGIKYIIDNYCI